MTAEVASLLIDLESELRQLRLWETESPSPQALASTTPFCVDTLAFNQWLQFVFLPTLQLMIERQMALPANCQITPMAEEFLRGKALPASRLLEVLAALDEVLS